MSKKQMKLQIGNFFVPKNAHHHYYLMDVLTSFYFSLYQFFKWLR